MPFTIPFNVTRVPFGCDLVINGVNVSDSRFVYMIFFLNLLNG
jgi:hypothetical protein